MPQDPKLERVPTFLETLIQSLLPNMADPVAMEDNARLLQQGGSGNTPERMKKILTVAGRGVADAAFGAAKSQVPESPEDIALQFGPLGPALGKVAGSMAAVGYVPKKWIKTSVNRLKNTVLNDPKTPFPDIVEEFIDRYPNVSSNLDSITPYGMDDDLAGSVGYMRSIGIPKGHKLLDEAGQLTDEHLVKQFDQGLGPFSGLTRKDINGNPLPSQYIAIDPNQFKDGLYTLANGQQLTPREVIRHEFVHAAQNNWRSIPQRKLSTEAIEPPGKYIKEPMLPYSMMPTEIGARMGQFSDNVRTPLTERLTRQLNDPSFIRDFKALPKHGAVTISELNRNLAGQGFEVVNSGLVDDPHFVVIRRIVLDKP